MKKVVLRKKVSLILYGSLNVRGFTIESLSNLIDSNEDLSRHIAEYIEESRNLENVCELQKIFLAMGVDYKQIVLSNKLNKFLYERLNKGEIKCDFCLSYQTPIYSMTSGDSSWCSSHCERCFHYVCKPVILG